MTDVFLMKASHCRSMRATAADAARIRPVRFMAMSGTQKSESDVYQ